MELTPALAGPEVPRNLTKKVSSNRGTVPRACHVKVNRDLALGMLRKQGRLKAAMIWELPRGGILVDGYMRVSS